MAQVCVFDVNETLLDVGALDPRFARTFGDASMRREWFTQMLQLAFVGIITHTYIDLSAAGRAALEVVATRHGAHVSDEDTQNILDGMRELPPHPDVRDALEQLRAAGMRLATLTNSPEDVTQAQLAHAGLRGYFEQALSADSIQRLKPAPEAYRMAAERLGVATGEILFVAAHSWDVAGAHHAGCATAFLKRPGMVLDSLAPRPSIIADNLHALADQIVSSNGAAIERQ